MGTLPDLESRYQKAVATLKPRGQDHVLRWWPELSLPEREHLLTEIESLTWGLLDELIPSHVLEDRQRQIPDNLEPPDAYPPAPRAGEEQIYQDAVRCGQGVLRAGKVAAFTVAGGQGTRLGFEGPKGAITVSPVRGKTLFQLFAEMIKAARDRYTVDIPWYLMTSPANHEQTVGFLENHEYFGLPQGDVCVFAQGMLPSFDFQGRLLLEDKHRIALAPDGHGGSLKALVASGAVEDMKARGIEIISYFQVDNALVKPFDPLFLGLHVRAGSEMSSKVAPKADDLERVGNLCLHDRRLLVIEYSSFPQKLARAKNADGSRRFDCGNLAIHLLDVRFVDRIIGQRFALPYNRAEKIVTWMDDAGSLRTPTAPNAIKLETFVFDALRLAKNPLVLLVDRAEEFSPVKNAKGVDSVETAIRDQIRRAARWLEAAGVNIPRRLDGHPDVTLEIAPSYAVDRDELKRRLVPPLTLQRGDSIYIA